MNWSVLGIEETKDKKAITAAYRKRVTQVNPEEILLEMVLSENREELYVFTAKDGLSVSEISILEGGDPVGTQSDFCGGGLSEWEIGHGLFADQFLRK